MATQCSVRRAAEAIEVASQESAVEIEAHLTRKLGLVDPRVRRTTLHIHTNTSFALTGVRRDLSERPCLCRSIMHVCNATALQQVVRTSDRVREDNEIVLLWLGGPHTNISPLERRPEVEERLTVVRTQEDEVRAIADEHLERETDLKKLLKKLHDEQQQQQQSVDQARMRIYSRVGVQSIAGLVYGGAIAAVVDIASHVPSTRTLAP